MKQIDKQFMKNGILYSQVIRSGNAAIYQLQFSNGLTVGYDVVLLDDEQYPAPRTQRCRQFRGLHPAMAHYRKLVKGVRG